MKLDTVWQWLWDHYTSQITDRFVLVDWTMWKDGRQVLMAALTHAGRCLPFLAVADHIQKMLRSQNQAEHAFFQKAAPRRLEPNLEDGGGEEYLHALHIQRRFART
ncbi:MAG: hypothetical protein ACJ74J_17835 [Blastocatellia bacterium]